MNDRAPFSSRLQSQPAHRKLSRDTVAVIGDLLPLCDVAAVLLAAHLAALVYASGSSGAAAMATLGNDALRAALAAAVLAPMLLCDRAYVAFASSRQTAALIRCYSLRFAMLIGVIGAIGVASHTLSALPHRWLALWCLGTLLMTALSRTLLVSGLRRLERKGVLSETIAVVGAGAVADHLIAHLLRTRGGSVDIVGVFDDRVQRRESEVAAPAGVIADLIELGKSRPMDWILITLPDSASGRIDVMLNRLKALSVPVGLCPAGTGIAASLQRIGAIAAATPPDSHAQSGWDAGIAAVEAVVPRWIVTVLSLPLFALQRLGLALLRRRPLSLAPAASPRLSVSLDNYELEQFAQVAARYGCEGYGYVVTPNADHLIRLHREPSFRALYDDAAYVLLDSRFIARLLRLTQQRHLPVCTGSDLTARLFEQVIGADDRLVLIGGSDAQAARLRARYGLQQLAHFNPPMGFIRDPQAVETCLQFVEAQSPFRYCLLAVGAPQQEMVAQQLKARGVARGMALCVGASISFLTGDERRAPRWMQQAGIEWLFRLLQAPGRLAGRYLLRGPQLFGLLRQTEIVLRAGAQSANEHRAGDAHAQRPAAASLRKRMLAPRAVRHRAARRTAATATP